MCYDFYFAGIQFTPTVVLEVQKSGLAAVLAELKL